MKQTKLDINDIVRTKAIVLDSDYPDEVVNKIVDGLDDLFEKAKALDKIKNFTNERLKEQKLTDEYDFGERLICEEIEEIIGGQTK